MHEFMTAGCVWHADLVVCKVGRIEVVPRPRRAVRVKLVEKCRACLAFDCPRECPVGQCFGKLIAQHPHAHTSVLVRVVDAATQTFASAYDDAVPGLGRNRADVLVDVFV